MFQYQVKNYTFKIIEQFLEFQEFINRLIIDSPSVAVFDTETTGLNVIKDLPFLMGVGWDNKVYVFDITKERVVQFYEASKKCNYVFAHNAKFDYHMLCNLGAEPPSYFNIADSLIVARLTEYTDDFSSIGLEELGQKYVSKTAKFAGDVIKEHIKEINKERLAEVKKLLKDYIKENKIKYTVTEIIDEYRSRVQFLEHPMAAIFEFIDQHYVEPTYESSYTANPDLMRSYLADDVVILLEYLKVAIPTLNVVDPMYRIFNQENKLIRVVAKIERTGMRADIEYLKASHYRVKEYIDKVYVELQSVTGRKFSSGQHAQIKKYFLEVHSIEMEKTDISALEALQGVYNDTVTRVSELILELRTLDKWLTTYIDGMLDRVQDGRIHTNINNQGTVTGRVSSDMQQQPKDALVNSEGEELFHPRRVFVNDEGTRTFYFDFSQMELRLQAHYTVLVAGGDTNLCRAFMPYKCTNGNNSFQYGNDISLEWLDEKGQPWKPTDLHAVTTLMAFPHLTVDHPDFKKYRKYGKVANFLKNYGGGLDAIHRQLKVTEEIAQALNNGYYKAFPKILDYQKWVNDQLTLFGYIENIYGRRYYISNKRLFYKAYNYLIQGGCADLVKEKEILVQKFIDDNKLKTKVLLPVHDELQLSIPKDEEWIVPSIKAIMDNNDSIIGTLPMICEVEVTNTNWAEKEDYE